MEKFIVAFNRDRDSYQVPLALAEAGRLHRLITDLYLSEGIAKSALARMLDVSHRSKAGLESNLVDCSLFALWQQTIGLKLARNEEARLAIFKSLDKYLSRQALRTARASGSALFLYSGYALECFSAPDMATTRKILFVFHPHAGLTRKILESDRVIHPEIEWSHQLHLREMEASDSDRLNGEIAAADELVCASSFTQHSVEFSGRTSRSVSVVPYGCSSVAGFGEKSPRRGRPARLLFVGQGMQRKGLHHLLKVWKRVAHWDAELTVVAGRLDPGAKALAESTGPAVRLLPALPRQELNQEFARADIFVMPSLVEGFGLVYLEALAAGCHVIGTPNTGLPDIHAPSYAVTITPVGDLDQLERSIANAITMVGRNDYSSNAVKEFARLRSWERFRAEIRQAIGLSVSKLASETSR